MMQQKLREQAERDRRKFERAARWRLKDTWIDFTAYLLWRNRYPVLNIVVLRIILLFEFSLLYTLFFRQAASSAMLIFFLLFIARRIFFAVSQYFRESLVQAELRADLPGWSRNFALFLACAVFFGATAGAGVLTAASILTGKAFEISLAGIWLLLLPAELCAQSLWTVMYTRHRLRRSFWLVVVMRLLPIAFMLTLGPWLSIYSYIAGLLIGRLSESGYLGSVAWQRLQQLRLRPALSKNWRSELKDIAWSRLLWRRVLFVVPLQCYSLGITLYLFSSRPELWPLYFLVYHITNMLTYPVQRVAYAAGVDLFLALKSGHLRWAERLGRKIVIASIFLTFFLSGMLALALLFTPAFFQFALGTNFLLFFLCIPLLIGLALFRSASVSHLWSGTEFYHNNFLFFFLCTGLLPLQLLLLSYFRANLSAVILLEALAYLLCALRLGRGPKLAVSSLFRQGNDHDLQTLSIADPKAWHAYSSALTTAQIEHSYILLLFAKNYHSKHCEHFLLKAIQSLLEPTSLGVRIAGGCYCYALPSCTPMKTAQIRKELLFRLGGQLGLVEIVQSHSNPAKEAERLLSKISNSVHAPRELRSVAALLIQSKDEPANRTFSSALKISHPHFQGVVRKELKERKIHVPMISSVEGCLCYEYSPNIEHINFSHRLLTGGFQSSIISKRRKPFVVFASFGDTWMIADTSELAPDKKLELLQLSYTANILSSIHQLEHHNENFLLSSNIFHSFSDKLGSCTKKLFSGSEKEALKGNILFASETPKGRRILMTRSSEG